jgi:hypothetical protein
VNKKARKSMTCGLYHYFKKCFAGKTGFEP